MIRVCTFLVKQLSPAYERPEAREGHLCAVLKNAPRGSLYLDPDAMSYLRDDP